MELPICRWRGEEKAEFPGRWECNSNKLIKLPQGVRASTCERCYCRDHEPVENGRSDPPAPSPLPHQETLQCPYLSRRVRIDGEIQQRTCAPCGGKKLDVFECKHPSRKPVGKSVDSVTLADCKDCLYKPRPVSPTVRRLLLKNHQSPGDALVMSAAIRSLHTANPGAFQIAVDTSCQALFEHNPDILPIDKLMQEGSVSAIGMHYPLVNQSNQRAIHFMAAYCDYLQDVLEVKVPLSVNRPIIHLSREEKEWIPQVQVAGKTPRYWVVCAGRKADYTAKFAGSAFFQKVVDLLAGEVLFVQTGSKDHHHPPLKGVINLIGKTDARQFVRLVYHAQGALCGVTFLHHLAAALEKPCVTIAGGREPVAWNSYQRCHLFHTVGMLDCCSSGGCWKSRTVALEDNDAGKNSSLCEQPIPGDDPIPRCMVLVRPERVAETIRLLARKS
jgi:ADP-heptose:LPS heptosyltransferase